MVDLASWKGQRGAGADVATAETSMLNFLPKVTAPTLVANGNNDIMVPTALSYEIFKKLPNAKLILYPDSGHGFLFQHAREFAHDVLAFLA
jgi:pimeloyl-ACP methyl ester carboxylesterase